MALNVNVRWSPRNAFIAVFMGLLTLANIAILLSDPEFFTVYAVFVLVPLAYYRVRTGAESIKILEQIFEKPGSIPNAFLSMGIGAAVAMGFVLVISTAQYQALMFTVFNREFAYPMSAVEVATSQLYIGALFFLPPVVTTMFSQIPVAVGEETVFRAIMTTDLGKGFRGFAAGTIASLLIQAFYFSISHGPAYEWNVAMLFTAFLGGILFGALYILRDIYAAIGGHLTFNTVVLTVFYEIIRAAEVVV